MRMQKHIFLARFRSYKVGQKSWKEQGVPRRAASKLPGKQQNQEKVITELQGWTKELEDAKAYFLGQIQELQGWTKELKEQRRT